MNYKKFKNIAQGPRLINAESGLESRQHGSEAPALDALCTASSVLRYIVASVLREKQIPARRTVAWGTLLSMNKD